METTKTKEMTLRELLEKDGYSSCNDNGIVVYDGTYGVLAVSHRYLAGGWNDVLSSYAERICKGQYRIIRRND